MARAALHTKTGFTLIELLVTVAIIAILARLLLPVHVGRESEGPLHPMRE